MMMVYLLGLGSYRIRCRQSVECLEAHLFE
jgi:hypothetical protein